MTNVAKVQEDGEKEDWLIQAFSIRYKEMHVYELFWTGYMGSYSTV